MILGEGVEVGRSNGATFDFQKSKVAADGHLGYTKMVITSQPVLPIDVMFGSRVGFSAELRFLPYRGLHTRTAVSRNHSVLL